MKDINNGDGQRFPDVNRGNTDGNISNLGYIAIDGDWVYFNCWREQSGLYKNGLQIVK